MSYSLRETRLDLSSRIKYTSRIQWKLRELQKGHKPKHCHQTLTVMQ